VLRFRFLRTWEILWAECCGKLERVRVGRSALARAAAGRSHAILVDDAVTLIEGRGES
jgi:hypothetical protein